jgi:hypothetical protein
VASRLWKAGALKQSGSVLSGVGIGSLVGIALGLAGFFFLISRHDNGMGGVMFLLLPFCAGFAIAQVTGRRETIAAAGWFAALVSLVILVAFRREGLLCAVLAFPLLLAGLAVGGFLGYLFRKYVVQRLLHRSTGTMIVFGLIPVLIVAGNHAEEPALRTVRREVVVSSILLQATPEQVWAQIQSIDSINAAKPLLMHIGLPVPLRCTLERGGVGAKRICYFENGSIEETVTGWDPPHSMQLIIDRTNMPGRHWLGFENATYELQPEGSATRLTRTTTITSHLRPVLYWRYFERLGVASEHEYLLRDVASRLNR